MKYSEKFERDWNWYYKWKDEFTFDGSPASGKVFGNKTFGKSAKECFYIHDSQGKIIPTNEPELLEQIFKCKGSINFHIKMWAESRAKGDLPKILFSKQCKEDVQKVFPGDYEKTIEEEFELLPWMIEAVEKQRGKYY